MTYREDRGLKLAHERRNGPMSARCRAERPRTGTVLRVLTLAGTVMGSGCGGATIPAHQVLSDSAGVPIVHSVAPQLSEPDWPGVSDTPSFVLGASHDRVEPALLWDRIATVLWAEDGSLIVLDRGSVQFRSFDASGRVLSVFGGRGGGPGEFSDVPDAALGEGGELLAWDSRARRLTRVSRAGELLQTITVPGDLGNVEGDVEMGTTWNLAPDGQLVRRDAIPLIDGAPFTPDRMNLPDRWELPVRISVVDPATRQVTRLPGLHGPRRQATNAPVTFDPQPDLWVGGAPMRIVVGGERHWELREYSMAGELVRILRAEIPQAAVPGLEGVELMPNAELIFRTYGRPDSLAAIAAQNLPGAFSTVLWDDQGSMWVRRNSGRVGFPNPRMGGVVFTRDESDPVFDVFGPDGEWRFTITVPRGHGELAAVSQDAILTVWQDELGVEFLHVYPLLRSGASR